MAAPVDTHLLIASPDRENFPLTQGAGPDDLADVPDPASVTALLDEGRLGGGVLVQRGRHYGFDNRLICAAAAADQRLRAICAVDGRQENCGSLARRLLTTPGVAGLRLMEPEKGADLSWLCGPGALAAWRAVADCAAIMDVHVFPWTRSAALPILAKLGKSFPQVRLLLDNCGAIAVEEGPPVFGIDALLANAVADARITVKISTMTLNRVRKAQLDPREVTATMVRQFGADRICWGSDVLEPGQTLEQAIADARHAVSGLPASDAEQVLSRTASELFVLS